MPDTELETAGRNSPSVTREPGEKPRQSRVRRIARKTGLVLALVLLAAWFTSLEMHTTCSVQIGAPLRSTWTDYAYPSAPPLTKEFYTYTYFQISLEEGAISLRRAKGEKRSWWQAIPGSWQWTGLLPPFQFYGGELLVPIWALFLNICVPLILVGRKPRAASPARKSGLAMFCVDCKYPLCGLTINRCPECGRSFNPDDPTTFRDTLKWEWDWPRRTETLAAAICLLDLWLLRMGSRRHELVLPALVVAAAAVVLSGIATRREKGINAWIAAVLLLASLWSLVRLGVVYGFVI